MPNTLDPNRIGEVIETIMDSEKLDRMSTWEQDFMESISTQYKRKGSLTEKQLDRLEEIYLKI